MSFNVRMFNNSFLVFQAVVRTAALRTRVRCPSMGAARGATTCRRRRTAWAPSPPTGRRPTPTRASSTLSTTTQVSTRIICQIVFPSLFLYDKIFMNTSLIRNAGGRKFRRYGRLVFEGSKAHVNVVY